MEEIEKGPGQLHFWGGTNNNRPFQGFYRHIAGVQKHWFGRARGHQWSS